MKAKLIDGRIVYAKKIIREGDLMVCNPTDKTLEKLGYKEVVETPAPEEEDGFYFIPRWEDNGAQIIRVWERFEYTNSEEDE